MNVIIYGTGKMAEYICYCFQNDSEYNVVAFCVDQQFLKGEKNKLLGLPVLCLEEVCLKYSPQDYLFHIAVGRNSARKMISAKISTEGFGFANYISSKASVWPDLSIGENVFIDQSCDIQPFVQIGSNVMLIGARIGHHSRISDNVLLSGNILAGNVTVGEGSFLGINSAVKEDVVIGAENIIGAGVFVKQNTKDYTMVSIQTQNYRTGSSTRFTMFSRPDKLKQ